MNLKKDVFDKTKELLSQMPELGRILTHWEDPFAVSKNQLIMLPDKSSNNVNDSFSIRFVISTMEKNADLIPYTQMETEEKIKSLLFSNSFPFTITGFECIFLDPIPQAPIVGVMDITVSMIINFIDDCDF